jgi:hypothetical protein
VNPELSLWLKALSGMMVGFFALNFWKRWLVRKRTAPRWGLRVPHLVLGLVLVSVLWGGYYQWRIFREAPGLAPKAREAVTAQWDENARRTVHIGLAGVGLGFALMALATVVAARRKPPQVARRARREEHDQDEA